MRNARGTAWVRPGGERGECRSQKRFSAAGVWRSRVWPWGREMWLLLSKQVRLPRTNLGVTLRLMGWPRIAPGSLPAQSWSLGLDGCLASWVTVLPLPLMHCVACRPHSSLGCNAYRRGVTFLA